MTDERLILRPVVQHVAHVDDVTERVDCLRGLARRAMANYLELGEALYREHEAGLWQRVRTATGEHHESEEAFWEEVLGVKRRSAYQLIAIGRIVTSLQLVETDRTALSGLGLVKLTVILPVLERQTTLAGLRHWIAVAETHTRNELREWVRKALGRSPRSPRRQSERVQTYLVDAMPDLESRQLAERFFIVGAEYVGSDNAVAILVAAIQETLGTWEAHAPESDIAP